MKSTLRGAAKPKTSRTRRPTSRPASRPSSRPAAERLKAGTNDVLKALLAPAIVLFAWETAARAGLGTGLIPAPSVVFTSWYQWLFGEPRGMFDSYTGTWFSNAYHSVRRVGVGFALAAAVAVPLGVGIGWNKIVSALFDPSVQMIRPIPLTAWVPFAIAAFGIRDPGAIFLIFLGAFFPIVVNTTHGVRDTDIHLIRAARMLGAGERQILLRVVLPSALPGIMTGLRLGVGAAFVAVIAAEMIAVHSGMGYVLWDAYYVGRMDIVIAAMFSVGLLGFLSDKLVVALGNRVLRWRRLLTHN